MVYCSCSKNCINTCVAIVSGFHGCAHVTARPPALLPVAWLHKVASWSADCAHVSRLYSLHTVRRIERRARRAETRSVSIEYLVICEILASISKSLFSLYIEIRIERLARRAETRSVSIVYLVTYLILASVNNRLYSLHIELRIERQRGEMKLVQ
jgi:hypothetical protein